MNDFLSRRLREDPNFSFGLYLRKIESIEKPLLNIYNKYKKKTKEYNKLIEIDQKKIVPRFFPGNKEGGNSRIYKSRNFDKQNKKWERYIPFPKLTNFVLNKKFLRLPLYSLEIKLRNRDIFLSFLKPYFSYPIKEIPVEEIDNTDLKQVSLNKMSGNTIKNPRGGHVLKVVNFDELKKIWKQYKPNSVISDFELNEFISKKLHKDSTFNLEDYLKLEAKAWEDFKRRYPHANRKNFSGEYYKHSFNIFYKHTPIEVLGDHIATTLIL